MPIWFEVLALSLAAYVTGLGLGWLAFGRTPALEEDTAPDDPTD